MSQKIDGPGLRVPLGLKASMEPTYEALLRRSRKRLQLMRSGQEKVSYLTDEQYLLGARLVIEDDQFVLVAPILEPPQGDLIGYPDPDPGRPSSGGTARGRAANDDDPVCEVRPEAHSRSPQIQGDPTSEGSAPAEPMDLGAALDALLRGDMLVDGNDPISSEWREAGGREDGNRREDGQAGPPSCGTSGSHPAEAAGVSSSAPRSLAAADADRLKVDQTLNCVEASSLMLTQVAEISETSADVVGDTRALERRTGLTSGPSRNFIAAREPEFVADVDGHPVPFSAPVVRGEVAGQEVVRILIQLLQTRAENDIVRVGVLEAKGVGVPGGVSTLGGHDIRFVGLADWQRGVLLILRGAGSTISMGVKEGISTARLERKPALVVDPGDWLELKRVAMEVLAAAGSPGAGQAGGADATQFSRPEGNDREAA